MTITSPTLNSNPVVNNINLANTLTKTQSTQTQEASTIASTQVKISQQAVEKQQLEQLQKNQGTKEVANDAIQVNSTIGKSGSVNNLTQHQAAKIYEQIARLLKA